jgi:hypothetical protein
MGRTCNGPSHISTSGGNRVCSHQRPRSHGGISPVGGPDHHQNDDATFVQEKNYFLSYKNIERACFRMFDANIGAQYKVSNNPTLTGWNSTMSIIDILTQLQDSYGKPTMMTLYQNDVTFWVAMAPTDSPEMLFYRIEQCQKIQRIGKLPYSGEQIIANAVRILIQSNIFPLKEFDAWEATALKTYPALKTFMHEAYGRRLTALALRSTSG